MLFLTGRASTDLGCVLCLGQQGPAVTPALSCVPRDTPSVRTLLLSYHQLISGKLERFMVELKDRCP